MSAKKLLLLLLAGGLAWWFFLRGVPEAPPGVQVAEFPKQTETQAKPFTFKDREIRPLADFSLKARVLSKKRYRFDATSDIAPFDLALGWQEMSDTAVLSHFSISQSGRWYEYFYDSECPIPPNKIVYLSANMHCLPADDDVYGVLGGLKKNSFVELEGYLVEVRWPGGGAWTSSLERGDSGNGACEVFWITYAREFTPIP